MRIAVGIVLLLSSVLALVEVKPDELLETQISGEYGSVPLYYGQADNYTHNLTISGVMIYYTYANMLADLQGMVVMFDSDGYFEPQFREFQAKGASAVVAGLPYAGQVSGQMMYFVDGKPFKDITIPIVQVDYTSYYKILQPHMSTSNQSVNVTVTFSETNTWKAFNECGFMEFWSVVVGICSLICIVEAVRRLVLIIHRDRFVKRIAITCLSVESLSNLLRLIMCIDPVRSFRIFAYKNVPTLILAPYFLTLITTLLIAFHLHDLLISTNIKMNSFLEKMKTPFMICLILIITFGVFSFAITSVDLPFVAEVADALDITILVMDVCLGIYFSFVARQLVSQLKNSNRKSNTTRITIRITSVIVGLFGTCAISFFVGGSSIESKPASNKLMWLLVYFFSMLISMSEILLFETKAIKNSVSSSSKGKKVQELETSTKEDLE